MALKKFCPKCGVLIGYADKYCYSCTKLYGTKGRKEYNKEYDNVRKNDKHYKFYKTPEWIKLRLKVLQHYKYLDIYEYYINGKYVIADTSHHIVELKEDWCKRLSFGNQFPCSSGTHKIIHRMYQQDKKRTQNLLNSLIEKYEGETLGVGKSFKVIIP